MKIKFTPLVIVSMMALLYGLYYAFSGKGGNLGGLAVIIFILIAGIAFLLHLGLREVFRKTLRGQVIVEILLIAIAAFLYFKENGRLVLHVPPHFKGYIMIVYGAANHPKLPGTGLFRTNIDLTVPNSGIIFNPGKRDKGISVVDSSGKKISSMKAGYGIPFAWDSLNCAHKNYDVDVLVFGTLPAGWLYKEDTLVRNEKKALACSLLNE